TTVWWGDYQPLPVGGQQKTGRPRRRLQRDESHQPISVAQLALAQALPAKQWRTVRWRDGVAQPLQSHFAHVRIRPAHRNKLRNEEWLHIEWPKDADEPVHYWFSNQPEDTAWQVMVETVMS